jgi:hypothetical protein
MPVKSIPEESMQSALVSHPAWVSIKQSCAQLRLLQLSDGSISSAAHEYAVPAAAQIANALLDLVPVLPHDGRYLEASAADFRRWSLEGFKVPDFHDSLVAFDPASNRVHGVAHVVVFPMFTQNGSNDRFVEAVLCEVVWPEFIAKLELVYSNPLFVPMRFLDFTAGYETNSAVLFPETVSVREIPKFTWGTIFADREAARFRVVTSGAAAITKIELPTKVEALLDDQELTLETFIMWDLIHDRTHMRGDLPFDPFMIKQRMPFFLYSLEELRCDLTAFRESAALERELQGIDERSEIDEKTLKHAHLVQAVILFDRIFRFPLAGNRIRNYDGLGGQLLFAHLHQMDVIQWRDVQLSIDWERLVPAVIELGVAIDQLYWASIDRPKQVHWLAAYDLVANVLSPNPASKWSKREFALSGSTKEWTDAVLDDEFPLSMFYEALAKKLNPIIESTSGIRG